VDVLVKAGHSIWTIACCYHSYACWQQYYDVDAQRVPAMSGATVAEAIERFVFGGERVVIIDRNSWPAN
jgi:hypothetical protein